jgi:hypothetical protein
MVCAMKRDALQMPSVRRVIFPFENRIHTILPLICLNFRGLILFMMICCIQFNHTVMRRNLKTRFSIRSQFWKRCLRILRPLICYLWRPIIEALKFFRMWWTVYISIFSTFFFIFSMNKLRLIVTLIFFHAYHSISICTVHTHTVEDFILLSDIVKRHHHMTGCLRSYFRRLSFMIRFQVIV